jgi:RNA polymerase sigma-70 factor (ECF subfamily)
VADFVQPAPGAVVSDPPSDLYLLRRYHAGRDMDAFTALLDRHQAELLRTAHAILGDAHAAQDAVQEAFLRLCREQEDLVRRPGDQLGGWLTTVVRNHCIDQLRRRRTQGACALPAAIAAAPEPSPPDVGGVWHAVGALPPLERAAVTLRYRDGLSYADIAARLGKTATHVGVLLNQAMQRLRRSPALAQLATEIAP